MPMHASPYLTSKDVFDAQGLMEQFGIEAGIEAAERAEKSRDLGNHIQFCRWRQIERLIVMLSVEKTLGTIH